MDIFNNLKLHNNNIDSSTLINTTLGDYTSSPVDGAIKYSGGTLQYYYSSAWHTLGTSDAQGMTSFSFSKGSTNGTASSSSASITVDNGSNIKIDTGTDNTSHVHYLKIYKGTTTTTWVGTKIPTPGAIGIYTENSPSTGTDHMVPIAIPTSTNSLGPTTSGDSTVKVQGDGKGTLSFSNTYYSGGTTVSTAVVKMSRVNISIPLDPNSRPINSSYDVFHLLHTKDVVVQTYFSQNKNDSNSYNFKLVQCDVEISSDDKITVSVRGIPSDGGVLKVIVFALTVSELGAQGDDVSAEGVTEREYSENTGESDKISGVTPTNRKNS